MSDQPFRSLLEVQFPIAHMSVESYKERLPYVGKRLNSLGKWWGTKPICLTRAIILASVFPAAEDPERWPEDLRIFLKCMSLDLEGMWDRKKKGLPPEPCFELASPPERAELFTEDGKWKRGLRGTVKAPLERRAFEQMSFIEQREYCELIEQIDGPPEAAWPEINTHLETEVSSLAELVQTLGQRVYGEAFTVGDAFSGSGSIPFAAAELGCNVVASDLNPVACTLTWGALNIIAGDPAFREEVHETQERLYQELDEWVLEQGYETSEEGWRAEAYLYCVEITVPEWDNWKIPLSPSWQVAPKFDVWVDLVPVPEERRFDFEVKTDAAGFKAAKQGSKQGRDIVCPPALWQHFVNEGRADSIPRQISYNQVVENAGGLRNWERHEVAPREGDVLGERPYCIRWGTGNGNERVYRAPTAHDLEVESRIRREVEENLSSWQEAGTVPSWRIEPGEKTTEPIRTRGWAYWHQLFNPRQLNILNNYSHKISSIEKTSLRFSQVVALGRTLDYSTRLARWLDSDGGGIGGAKQLFYNQAFNTMWNHAVRGLKSINRQITLTHSAVTGNPRTVKNEISDARFLSTPCHLWITDPPYADAVNYEELSEFFLAWYEPHIRACFPEWYTDSMREQAVKGDDAPFRVAMMECYRNLAENMPDDGMQVLMFTHKDTDVWEDLALIMWAAGLQVKQVWSVATETPGAGIRTGNYVQATYNMVLRKRPKDAPEGFVDFITPQVNQRVKEVITHMRESQVQGGLTNCGYTDTDYLLAAQATAAEVVTGYSSIDGVDLEEELRTPNKERGRSALRKLMENAKRTATDFLVPPGIDAALRDSGAGGDPYRFWRAFSAEEKFLLKGLEMEALGADKLSVFQDLGRAYGLSEYEELMGPVEANNARTKLPGEYSRKSFTRYDDVAPAERDTWENSITRHVYEALKLLGSTAGIERAMKHLLDHTDFWNIRADRLAVILRYLREITRDIDAWTDLREHVESLALNVENWRA